MSKYSVTVQQNKINLGLSTASYNVSLSRTGGQGTKGDSITDVYIDGYDLKMEVSNSAGQVVEVITAGSFDNFFSLDGQSDVTITSASEGDVLLYDSGTLQWKNHQLTTSKLLDVDNTNKEDGAVLVYDDTANKYQATNRIEKQTTHIIGGSF